MSFARKSYLTGAVLAIAVISSLLATAAASLHRAKAAPARTSKRLGEIHGTVYAQLDAESNHKVLLPDISVFLKDLETGKEADAVLSNASGRYSLSVPKPGTYQLCWKGQGWLSACDAKPITISNGQTKFPGMTRVFPDLQTGIITGHVTLADGSGCQFSDPLFGVGQSSAITVLNSDGKRLGQAIHANLANEYVLSGLPQTRLRIQASCGGASAEQWLTPSAKPSADAAADLVIGNNPPKIVNMSAQIAGSLVTGVATESKVTLSLEARDDDGDPLQVTWAATPGAGKLLFNSGNTVDWIASRSSGENTIYALVSDGKGGYTRGAIDINVGAVPDAGENTNASPNWRSLNNVNPDITAASSAFAHVLAAALPKGVPPNGIPFLTKKEPDPPTNANDAIQYYLAVDPEGRRTFLDPSAPDPQQTHTLADWWNVVGFNPDGSGGVRTAYLNNNDLGFGRDMHCLQGSDEFGNITLACYVTNYGKPDQNIKNADQAWKSWNSNGTPNNAVRNKAVATVCMEYTVVDQDPSGIPVVKFFVYQGGNGAGHLLLSADLDGGGQKFVPVLCLNCHGGNYQPGVADLGASFREFDLASFRYSKLGGASRSKQEARFADQNLMVQSSNPAPAIQEIIENWYFSGSNDGSHQDSNAVPSGWSSHPDLYLKVVAKSCRTCHVAQASVSDDSISWDTYDQFRGERSTIQDFVCSSNQMPHALITYKNFWLSKNPHRPDFLANFQAADWVRFGSCK